MSIYLDRTVQNTIAILLTMLKILLIGKNGQVGWELRRTLAPLGEVIALGSQDLDLAQGDRIRSIVDEIQPQLIVNAAAYTAVDKAESEPEVAMAINGIAPGILAEAAGKCGASLIHYSTDYVFDGTNRTPYTEQDEPNPMSVYGKTKLAGEIAIARTDIPYMTFRTSWVYGLRGKNFLLTILRLAREREELRIVGDQFGAPTWCRSIAEATGLAIAATGGEFGDKSGIYHLTGAGETSWYEFTKEIIDLYSALHPTELAVKRVVDITTLEYPTPAKRPMYSVLSGEKLGDRFDMGIPSWDSQLAMCLG
jgi:dTDP-4-dehydrorhamnose reductase